MANQAPAPASGAQQGQQQQPTAPFRVGVQRVLYTDGYTNSTALGSSATELPEYNPSPNAFLRGLWILCEATTSSNTATVAFNADAPFNVYSSVTFNDSNQRPIVGPIDGYTLAVINKYGGYQYNGDPRASAVYSASAGSSGTDGGFTFVLYVPLEVASRDALGDLENKTTAQPFALNLTLNTSGNVYSTAPTNSVTVKTRIIEDGHWQPKAATANGQPLSQEPPAPGSTQYWTRGSYNALNGSVQQQLQQGLGYPIRNHVLMAYDTSDSTRATAEGNFPDPCQFIYKGTSIFNVPKVVWRDQMSRDYRFTSTSADAANGLEDGVFILPYNRDFGMAPGDELRNGYLVTQQGDQFQLVGSFGACSTLYTVVNYVAPGNGNPDSLRAGA